MEAASRIVTVTRKEYVLPSPTNWAEVDKVFKVIANQSQSAMADDAVTVEARDDEVVISYLMSVETSTGGF